MGELKQFVILKFVSQVKTLYYILFNQKQSINLTPFYLEHKTLPLSIWLLHFIQSHTTAQCDKQTEGVYALKHGASNRAVTISDILLHDYRGLKNSW